MLSRLLDERQELAAVMPALDRTLGWRQRCRVHSSAWLRSTTLLALLLSSTIVSGCSSESSDPDASPTDTGTDAGVVDASAMDSGTSSDAAVSDTGPADAAPADAGTDAGGDAGTDVGVDAGADGGVESDAGLDHVWSRRFGDPGFEAATLIRSLPGTDNLVMTGRFSGDLPLDSITLSSPGGSLSFVAGLDTDGITRWALNTGDVFVWDLDVDSAGATVVVGRAFGEVDWGLPADIIPCCAQLVVGKFDAAGNHVFSRGEQGFLPTSAQREYAVATGPAGEIYVAGVFDRSFLIGGTTLEPTDDDDVFVLALTSAGRSAGPSPSAATSTNASTISPSTAPETSTLPAPSRELSRRGRARAPRARRPHRLLFGSRRAGRSKTCSPRTPRSRRR